MSARLSKRQREVLEVVKAACAPVYVHHDRPAQVVPLYILNVPDLFWTERERERFLENLQSRGLIRVEKRNFIYITDAGETALAAVEGK